MCYNKEIKTIRETVRSATITVKFIYYILVSTVHTNRIINVFFNNDLKIGWFYQ